MRRLMPLFLILLGGAVWWWADGQAPRPDAVEDDTRARSHEDAIAPDAGAHLAGTGSEGAPSTDVATLRRDLASEDPEMVAEAGRRLRARIKADTLSLDALWLLASHPAETERVRLLAGRALLAKAEAALPLLPTLLDALRAHKEGDDLFAAALVRRIAGDEGYFDTLMLSDTPLTEDMRTAFQRHLPQVHALVSDPDVDETIRVAMLPILARLGTAASDSAPALVAWIVEIYAARNAYRAENPMVLVSWGHTPFAIQETLSTLGPAALAPIKEALGTSGRGMETPHYTLHRAVEELGPAAQDALWAELDDEESPVRSDALAALARMHKDDASFSTHLERIFEGKMHGLRAQALDLLVSRGEDVDDLVLRALDGSRALQSVAIKALGSNPTLARRVLPRLLTLAKDARYSRRLSLVRVFAALGADGAAATPFVLDLMVEQLDNPYMDGVSDSALAALRAFGPEARPHLLAALADERPLRQQAAVVGLAALPDDPSTQEALVRAMERATGTTRIRIATALARSGHPAATPVLLEALRSADLAAHDLVLEGVARTDSPLPAALPLVEASFRRWVHAGRDDQTVRRDWWKQLVRWTSALRTLAEGDVATASRWLLDDQEELREIALDLLLPLGAEGRRIVEAAWPRLSAKEQDRWIDRATRVAYGEAQDAAWRTWVEERIAEGSDRLRLAWIRAGLQVKRPLPEVVPVLLRLLASPEETVPQGAAWILQDLGHHLAPFETALREAQPKEEGTPRAWVQQALDAIEDAR